MTNINRNYNTRIEKDDQKKKFKGSINNSESQYNIENDDTKIRR